jgi:single-stranded DNA-specific DHH superfamily exonuclease
MLTKKQITEIKEHLDKAQNPLFFFDNDVDGLTGFLILQRYLGRGKGVIMRGVKSFNQEHFRKVEELNPDYVFLVDFTPEFDKEFLDFFEQKGIPFVCIDHHDVPKPKVENYYNTFHTSKKNEPVAHLCYNITEKKEDMWLAVMGCIADCYVPDYFNEFKKKYPGLGDYAKKGKDVVRYAFDIRYNTELGKMIHVLAYGLFDTTTNVVNMLRYLMKARGPYDILEENSKTKSFLIRYEFINKKVKNVIEKAEEHYDKKLNLIYHSYSGDMSVSQYVSDELNYKYPGTYIIINFSKGNSAKFSVRGPNVRGLILESIKNIEGARGGGHKDSSGAQMTLGDLPVFKKNLIKNLEKMQK